MSTKAKASELRQERAKILDEARELVERVEKENRAMTKDEDVRHKQIITDSGTLAQRISTIERQLAVERMGDEPAERKSDPLPHEDANNVGTRHTYSILKAARQIASKGAEPFGGLEAEVSQELVKRTGKTPLGFMMPYSTRGVKAFEKLKRDLDSGRESRNLDSVVAGGASVQTTLGKDWIELLRNSMRVKEAGAREIMGLVGKFAIPRQNAASTAYWLNEGGSPTGTTLTLDQVLMTPHTIGAFTDVNRRWFELSNIEDGDEIVKQDLTAVLGRGIDLAALNGSGGSYAPLGLAQNTAITSGRTVALGTNGASPAFTNLVEMHTIVARGNAADLGEFVYMGNADVEGTLATTVKYTGQTYPIYILEDGKIYSKRFLQTQQIPNNLTKGSGSSLSMIIAGIFNQLILAYWSGVDMLVDPFTGSSSGTVRIVALQDMDIQARHNEAFAFIFDMLSNQTQ